MKALGLLGLIFACSSIWAEAPAPPGASRRPIHEAFPFVGPTGSEEEKPSDGSTPAQSTPASYEMVQMEPFVVTDLIARQDLAKAIRDRAAAEAANSFSWKKGGLLTSKKIGAMTAEVGIWPTLELNRGGPPGNKDVLLKVELLHLRW